MGLITSIIYIFLKMLLNNVGSFLVFSVVFLFTKLYLINDRKRLPPGPWGLPVVGFLPFLGTAMHETLHKLSKKYGPIFQLSLGVKRIVVLTDPDIIRQAFKREEFTGRPNNKLYDMFQGYGVINIAGDRWKEQRKFLHGHLKALGMKVFGSGREHMESRIMTEVQKLLQALSAHEGKAINVDSYLKNASANVVCSMMMSVTFQRDNPIFQRFMELHKQGFQLFMSADIANYVPIFKYSSSVQKCMKQLQQNREESLSMLKNFVNERKENFDPNVTRDIIDAYLQKEYLSKMEGNPVDKNYDCQLLQVMCDLFSAGQETVNHCLNWCLIYLLHNQDVIAKVQEELNTVVGPSRLPSLDDMPSLPYTEATICEVLRRSNVVPLGTPHSTTKDTYVGEFFIPAGTTVFSNLYSCHMNPDIWSNPEKFDPNRFLDAEGKLFKPKAFMPFGVGRRMCLGEVLARSEIFLFVTSILHVFHLKTSENAQPTLKGISGISTTPELYEIRFIPKENSAMMNTITQSTGKMTRGL